MGGAYKVKKLAARDSHFLLNNFLIKNFGVGLFLVLVVLVVLVAFFLVVAVVACHYFFYHHKNDPQDYKNHYTKVFD